MTKQDKCLLCSAGSTAAMAVANIGLCGIILMGLHSEWFRITLPFMIVVSLLIIGLAARVMRMILEHRNDP